MNEENHVDPNDVLWSDSLVNIVNRDVRQMLGAAPNEPSSFDAHAVSFRSRPVTDETARFNSYAKLEYELMLPESKHRVFDTIMTEELHYDPVPFKTGSPDDVAKWENKKVYRFGPQERFVQITAYFVPDRAFEEQYADRTA